MIDFNFLINAYLSIYMYIYTILTFIFFLKWVSFFEITKTVLGLKNIYLNFFIRLNLFLFLTSLIGVPPMFGFFTKFIIFLNLIFFQNLIQIFFFFFFNGFLMVFYLNQYRYLQSNFNKVFFVKVKQVQCTFSVSFFIISQIINVFAIIFIPILINIISW